MLGELSPGRLSPNLFIGINLDSISNNRNTLSTDWMTFAPPPVTTTSHHMHPEQNSYGLSIPTSANTYRSPIVHSNHLLDTSLHHMDNCASAYDEIKYLNVDHFGMDAFKSDCILNMDQSMMLDDKIIGSGSNSTLGEDHSEELDMHSAYVLHHHDPMDGKTSPLIDMEKPIMNITVETSYSNCAS